MSPDRGTGDDTTAIPYFEWSHLVSRKLLHLIFLDKITGKGESSDGLGDFWLPDKEIGTPTTHRMPFK